METLKQKIDSKVFAYKDNIISLRRALHEYPELSGQERFTSEKVCQELERIGVSYEAGIAGYGVVAWIDGEIEGVCRAFRADMDALPIQENTGLEFASKNEGVMHACGHDFHTSCLLGSIMITNALKQYLKGRVIYIFQPSEEVIPSGAEAMINSGILEKYKPEWMIAQHVSPELPVGTIGYHSGYFMASSDEIYLLFKGKGGHAAKPVNCINPISMASHFIYEIENHKIENQSLYMDSVLEFGKMIANGATNVIPDTCEVAGTLRTFDKSNRSEIQEILQDFAFSVAKKFNGQVEVKFVKGAPTVNNNEGLCANVVSLLKDTDIRCIEVPKRMGSEDFGHFSDHLPICLLRTGTGYLGQSEYFNLHDSRFMINEESIPFSVQFLSYLSFLL